MVSKDITVKNEQGLHMRPAGLFTKAMGKFQSDVQVVFNGKKFNGKSIMNLMAACIKGGADITIECSGEDEQAALDAAVELIESGLGE